MAASPSGGRFLGAHNNPGRSTSSPDHAIKDGNPRIGPTRANESAPLMIGATLYTSTSRSQVAAIDAATGKAKWVLDPKVYDNGLGIPPNAG